MFFPSYSTQFRRQVEDVYLPGDEELYAPVVLESRRGRRWQRDSLHDVDIIDQVLWAFEQDDVYTRRRRSD